jgi:hypothetical protein
VTPDVPAVGYVLRKFPVLSETFILNEILALESRGLAVHVFTLAPSRDPRFHEGVGRLKATIHHVPGVTDVKALWASAKRLAHRSPRHFRRQLGQVLMSGRPKLLWRFLQASYVADRARRAGVRHLHAHFANHPATVAHQASKLIGTSFSFTAHAFDMYRDADPRVIVRKMSDARFTITISEYNGEVLRGMANGHAPRIELVRNGIDMTRFAPPSASPACRSRFWPSRVWWRRRGCRSCSKPAATCAIAVWTSAARSSARAPSSRSSKDWYANGTSSIV